MRSFVEKRRRWRAGRRRESRRLNTDLSGAVCCMARQALQTLHEPVIPSGVRRKGEHFFRPTHQRQQRKVQGGRERSRASSLKASRRNPSVSRVAISLPSRVRTRDWSLKSVISYGVMWGDATRLGCPCDPTPARALSRPTSVFPLAGSASRRKIPGACLRRRDRRTGKSSQ